MKMSERDWWERFQQKLHPPDPVTGCVRWKGAHDKLGYGRFSYDGHAEYAHVMAYYHATGEWPLGYVVRRESCPRDCVRADHLVERSQAYNPDLYSAEHRARNITKVRLGREGAAQARLLWDYGDTAEVIAAKLECPMSTAYKAASGKTWSDDSAREDRVARREKAKREREAIG
jgi:hypothetical protein